VIAFGLQRFEEEMMMAMMAMMVEVLWWWQWWQWWQWWWWGRGWWTVVGLPLPLLLTT